MIKKLKPKSEFSRNVLTLMTGTTIAQAIPIAISPILTRIYSPEDFGVFALYMSIAFIFSTIATGRYELAIMLPRKDIDALNILALSLIIAVIVSFISFFIIFFFNDSIVDITKSPEISIWLYFIPLTILFRGGVQSFSLWFNRKKKYRTIATSKVIQTSTVAITNISVGLLKQGSGGLIIGDLLGTALLSNILGRKVWVEEKKYFKKINKLKIFCLAKKYKKLPLLNLPNAFIDSMRLSGIIFLIAKFFSTAMLGQFSLAWKMLQAPLVLIGSALSQVFFQKTASSKADELFFIVRRFVFISAVTAFPIFMLIYLFSVDVFIFVFGAHWELAGKIASALSPWLFFNFITSPLSTLFITLNKQEYMLIFSIFYMLTPLLTIFMFHDNGFLYVINIMSLCMSIMLLLFIFLTFYILRR